MQIRYRRGTAHDVVRGFRLLDPDRRRYDPHLWQRMPRILEDLLERERILLCVFDNVETGEIVYIEASGFLAPDFLETALAERNGIVNAAMCRESGLKSAFLNTRQIAEGNRSRDLILLNFFGVPPLADAGGNEVASVALGQIPGLVPDAYSFFHKGFGLREVWADCCASIVFYLYSHLGFGVRQERTLADGSPAKLLCFTREDAMATWPSILGSVMISPRPRMGFTKAERQLPELALLDHSDRDAATALHLSAEAIKKRWRSIYKKVSQIEAALLPPGLSGSSQRRALLQNLRGNLQELRPYRPTPTG